MNKFTENSILSPYFSRPLTFRGGNDYAPRMPFDLKFRAAPAFLLSICIFSCAPSDIVTRRIDEAETRIAEARAVEAARFAPLHLSDAESALRLARTYHASNNAQAADQAGVALESAHKAYEIARLGFDLERTRKELSETRAKAKADAERLRAEISALEEEKKRIRAEGDRYIAERDRLRNEVEAQTRALATAAAANRALDSEVASLATQIGSLEADRTKLSSDRERLTADLADRTEEMARLAARGDSLAASLDALARERAALELKIAEKNKALESARADAGSLRFEIAARESDMQEAKADLDRLAKERDQAAAEKDALREAQESALVELARLTESNEADRTRMARDRESALLEMKRMTADRESAAAEQERLRKAQETSDAELDALRKANAAELERLRVRAEELDSGRAQYELDLLAANEALALRDSELNEIRIANEKMMADLRGLSSEQVKLREEAGRIILTFVDKILFESGKSDILPEGAVVLRQVAKVLSDHPDRMIQIAGHTDTVPITKSERFPSNWELSVDRASKVLRFLLEAEPKLAPSRFVAAGFGEFHPVASNQTPDGRRENRRVEIVILRGKL
ncbi:MAG: OmpA family protein [Candidatus Hydrogenedentota bacterium]